MQKRIGWRVLVLILVALTGFCLLAGGSLWQRYGGLFSRGPLPAFPTIAPFTPWPTPVAATAFDFPLLPSEAYGPYIQGVTGPLAVDTRYGMQNPSMGNQSNCFRNAEGDAVPFSELYHAGIDLFALDSAGRTVWGQAAHVPVHAVAGGVVVFTQQARSDGYIIIVQHLLADESFVYSVYWHVDHLQVEQGQPVTRGQVIAVVYDKGLNSHLHWEMRTFRDASDLFPRGTAGARGTCNGRTAGVGYAWDDDPDGARPGAYGYLDPVAFVQGH